MKKTINLKKMTIAGAALLGLGTATVAIVNSQIQPTVVKASSSQNNLSQADAIEKFQAKYSNAQISSISLEKENGNYVYEIEGFDNTNEYSAEVNAQTGQLSYAHSEKLDRNYRETALDLNNVISRDEASSIAENRAGGTAQEWTLEQEGNTAYWEVKLSNGTEVKINANTKQVVSTEKDDNDCDDDRNKNQMTNKTNSSHKDHDDDDDNDYDDDNDRDDHDDDDKDDKDDNKNKSTHDHDDDDDDRDDDRDDDND